jgi:hypothetical protein
MTLKKLCIKVKFTTFVRILFIYCLSNDALSSSDYITLNERMILNNEFERMWKVVVMA